MSAVTRAAQALPTIGARQIARGMTVQPQPQDRDEPFDQAMTAFIEAARTAIAARASFEQEVAANEHLAREECRILVHRYLGTQRDRVQCPAIVVATRLSGEQVHDALEQLEYEGLLGSDTIKSEPLDGSVGWCVRLGPAGRSLLDGTKPARPAPSFGPITTITGSTFTNSPVAITGVGDVSVTVQMPSIPPDLRAALDSDSTAALQLRALEEEVAKPTPRRPIVSQLFGGLRTTIESMNLGTEVAAHGHEWLAAVHIALAHLLQ
ncbi:MAG: hypothetical protein ACYDBM_03755 [Candidatus Tyrphobacter sp.]